MNWLFEQRLVIVIIGIALLLALGATWSATGKKELLYAMGVSLALMLVGLIVERLVITDREAIHATLLTIARDVQSNNLKAVVRHVHSSTPELKQRAEAELPNYHFTECRITQIHDIKVDASTKPRSAVVEFNLIAVGDFKGAGIELTGATIPRWVRLQMAVEKDGRWAVQHFEHAEPQHSLFKQPMEK